MPNGDPNDFTGRYNTSLQPDSEAAFQQWAQQQSALVGRDVTKDSYDYDLRGWWKNNNGASLSDGHLTDEFKKPNHPTFSDQSRYNGVDGYKGGQWQQNGNAWSFTPGASNVFSVPDLQGYFKQVEPGNTLNVPMN